MKYEPIDPPCEHDWTLTQEHFPMTSSFEPFQDYECSKCKMQIRTSSGVVEIIPKGDPLYWLAWEALYGKSPYHRD